MSPEQQEELILPTLGRCNVTGVTHTIPTTVFLPPSYNGHLVTFEGEDVANCPTGDGTATALGQVFRIDNGVLTEFKTFAELHTWWHIHFTHCCLDAQEFGSNNEHMVSIIYFQVFRGDDLERNNIQTLSATIRQPYGGEFDFETTALTVMPPIELQGLIDFNEFSQAVEGYFRHVVGSQGQGVRLGSGVTHTRLSNINISIPGTATIHAVEPQSNSAWGAAD